MKIKVLTLLTSMLLIIGLGGCGTSDTSDKPEQNDSQQGTNGGIIEGEMKTTLTETSPHHYQLSVQNNKTKEETLTFHSSQDFDYQIKDKDGNVAYTYSADKLFMQAIEEEVLKPGERLEFELDITEAFSYLEAGDYTLEAWVTAEGFDKQKNTITFT